MFHVIPLLKKLQDRDIEAHLACGKYEVEAARLLLHLGLITKLHSNEFIDGGINSDMGSIVRFLEHIGTIYERKYEYDYIIEPARNENEDPNGQKGLNGLFSCTEEIGIDFGTVPWAVTDIPKVIVGGWDKNKTENYIAVQPASISGFKTYNPLYGIEYPGDVKSFGFLSDTPIMDAIQIHGRTMIEVYEELLTCSMVVSTHSSIGVLAYYLGIPQLFIHFWKGGLANIEECETSINIREPGRIELQLAIDDLYRIVNGGEKLE
jgi:hypothetical protein